MVIGASVGRAASKEVTQNSTDVHLATEGGRGQGAPFDDRGAALRCKGREEDVWHQEVCARS